jgi:hypothetical protein
VQVRFALPISGKIISSPAIARWRRASRHGEGATGLEFVELPEAAAEDIAKYVEYFADPE